MDRVSNRRRSGVFAKATEYVHFHEKLRMNELAGKNANLRISFNYAAISIDIKGTLANLIGWEITLL